LWWHGSLSCIYLGGEGAAWSSCIYRKINAAKGTDLPKNTVNRISPKTTRRMITTKKALLSVKKGGECKIKND
jgi:hypothetical protein